MNSNNPLATAGAFKICVVIPSLLWYNFSINMCVYIIQKRRGETGSSQRRLYMR
ncbi:MAG: hypothetical protein LBS21_06015 [Clostridiales bacterium]|nr:hypothetical protein [Clostridiales bacterium]